MVLVVGFLFLFGFAGFDFWLVVFIVVLLLVVWCVLVIVPNVVIVFVWLFGCVLLLIASSCCCCCPFLVPVGCFPVLLLVGLGFGFLTSCCCAGGWFSCGGVVVWFWFSAGFGLVSMSGWCLVGFLLVSGLVLGSYSRGVVLSVTYY